MARKYPAREVVDPSVADWSDLHRRIRYEFAQHLPTESLKRPNHRWSTPPIVLALRPPTGAPDPIISCIECRFAPEPGVSQVLVPRTLKSPIPICATDE